MTTTIDNAKRKIEDMPHAKKQLNPLWGLLAEPLGQILAAVGLLLSGVLGLVGQLVSSPLSSRKQMRPLRAPFTYNLMLTMSFLQLSGLGLGGLVDGLLGGLGLKKILGGLGLGDVVGSLTGKKDGKKGGGLFG